MILFVASYHKGEINVLYSYCVLLRSLGVASEIVYCDLYAKKRFSCTPLRQAYDSNYLFLSGSVKLLSFQGLLSYIISLNPLTVSLDIDFPREMAVKIKNAASRIVFHLHAHAIYHWTHFLSEESPVKFQNADLGLLMVHDKFSCKYFQWRGFFDVKPVNWSFLHSSVQLDVMQRSSPEKNSNNLILYSYEWRQDLFPLSDWLYVHRCILEAARFANKNVLLRSHPTQSSSQVIDLATNICNVDIIDHLDTFSCSLIPGIHVGVFTSGPLLAYLLGQAALSIYPVRRGIIAPEHGIYKNHAREDFTSIGITSLFYYDSINTEVILSAIHEASSLSSRKFVRPSDSDLEEDIIQAYCALDKQN